MNDAFARNVDYLRISVTDRCNERCLYCMPEGYKGWERQAEHLSGAEIVEIVRVAVDLGFRTFRLTGGEPLVRKDILEIVQRIKTIPGVTTIGISTNGTKLSSLATPLREAGVDTVNVSLDAVDPTIYRNITGGNITDVREGIHSAMAAGFKRVKLNCVLMRGRNESEIWPLIHFAAKNNLPLRFIELMPVSRADVLTSENFLPVAEVMQLLAKNDQLIPQENHREGNGPAKYYLLEKARALIGFIGAMTNLSFCENCNKVRLTCDGKLRPCLGDHMETDLRPALRPHIDENLLNALFRQTLAKKPAEHSFRTNYQPQRVMTAIGG